MIYVVPHLRTQLTLLGDIEIRLRDTSNARWSDAELYASLSDACLRWSGRVSIPFIYTISGGWVEGTYEYTLPEYMGKRIQPQRRIVHTYGVDDEESNEYVWADVLGWSIEPDSSGGHVLRLENNEGIDGAVSDARILWWGEQGPLPSTIPTVQTTINSTDTSLILSAIVNVGPSGYVYVGTEWIQYSGFTDNGTYTTLTNLVRAINGSTAASHNSAVSVYFGVALPELRLTENLYHQAMANAHAYGLTDVNETERTRYEWNMRYYQQLADEFWMRWTPTVSPRMRLTRRAG